MEHQRIKEWIGDAFAILAVRVSGASPAETNLRLGFEAILRQLGTPPLRLLAQGTAVPFCRVPASASDFRHIVKALDSCLAVFQRYENVLTAAQKRIRLLVQSTRRFAEEELQARRAARLQPAPCNAA